MIKIHAAFLVLFMIAFGLLCFGIGVLFMQYRGLQERAVAAGKAWRDQLIKLVDENIDLEREKEDLESEKEVSLETIVDLEKENKKLRDTREASAVRPPNLDT